jgi:hypothetical protein
MNSIKLNKTKKRTNKNHPPPVAKGGKDYLQLQLKAIL